MTRIRESPLGIEKSGRRARDILYWSNMNAQISDLCKLHLMPKTQEEQCQRATDPSMKFLICFGKNSPVIYLPLEARIILWLLIIIQSAYRSAFSITALWDTKSSPNINPPLLAMEYPMKSFQISVLRFQAGNWNSAESWERRLTTSSPKQPASQWQVENAIGTTKSAVKKAYEDGTDPYIPLIKSRNTPITGMSNFLALSFP